jgi:hypothetical protein
MRDMGIDEAGMAEIEDEIVANPTHPMIRGLKGAARPVGAVQGAGRARRGNAIAPDERVGEGARSSEVLPFHRSEANERVEGMRA